ncbi:MAG: hypothetical protein KatS3mg102_2572 [Planctomycetota bacterium]|nr:MAG: hypothetical protein KatS3mg102_2572 [Planctomycetota bacterium]
MSREHGAARSLVLMHADVEVDVELEASGARRRPHPWLSLVLAWLVPGAGHWLLGQRWRGVSFFVLLVMTFAFGWGASAGHAVSLEHHPVAFWLQLPAGGPMLLALGFAPGLAVPPPEVVARLDLALTFTMVAGLLNLLLVHDAWERAVVLRRGACAERGRPR